MFRSSSAQIPAIGYLAADADKSSYSGFRRAALAACLLAGIIAAAVGMRAPIVKAAPRMAALFDVLGMRVNLVNLDIVSASARVLIDADRRVLLVEGEVANATTSARTVPPMRVAVRSTDGQPLYIWTTQSTRQRIEPGERAAFSARLASPPADGADVVVEFDQTESRPAQPKTTPDKRPPSRMSQGSRTESQ